MWDKCLTSILNPKDQEHKSIFDFKELFGDVSEDEQSRYKVVRQTEMFRVIDQIEENKELNRTILEALMTYPTVRKAMENVHIFGNETQPFYTFDGLLMKVPYRSETENLKVLKRAIEEMGKKSQLDLKMTK